MRGIMIAYARVDVGVRAGASHADGNIRTERVFCLEECGCVEAVRVHTGGDGGGGNREWAGRDRAREPIGGP